MVSASWNGTDPCRTRCVLQLSIREHSPIRGRERSNRPRRHEHDPLRIQVPNDQYSIQQASWILQCARTVQFIGEPPTLHSLVLPELPRKSGMVVPTQRSNSRPQHLRIPVSGVGARSLAHTHPKLVGRFATVQSRMVVHESSSIRLFESQLTNGAFSTISESRSASRAPTLNFWIDVLAVATP